MVGARGAAWVGARVEVQVMEAGTAAYPEAGKEDLTGAVEMETVMMAAEELVVVAMVAVVLGEGERVAEVRVVAKTEVAREVAVKEAVKVEVERAVALAVVAMVVMMVAAVMVAVKE